MMTAYGWRRGVAASVCLATTCPDGAGRTREGTGGQARSTRDRDTDHRHHQNEPVGVGYREPAAVGVLVQDQVSDQGCHRGEQPQQAKGP